MKSLVPFFAFALLLGSCTEKFETDEEIRENIGGVWVRKECFPAQQEEEDGTNVHPLPGKFELRTDGSYVYFHPMAYCIEEGCDTAAYPSFCTCSWFIDNGSLVITADNGNSSDYFNIALPITCMTKNRLEFGNVVVNGTERVTRCYKRD